MNTETRPTTVPPAAIVRLASADETLWLVSVNPGSKAHLAYESGRNIIAVCNGRAMGRFALPLEGMRNVERCARCVAVETRVAADLAQLTRDGVIAGPAYCVREDCGQIATHHVSIYNAETDALVQTVAACKLHVPAFLMGHRDDPARAVRRDRRRNDALRMPVG